MMHMHYARFALPWRGAVSVALIAAACAAPLAPRRAQVAILCSEPDAELTVDGVPRGEARDYAGGAHHLLLAPGAHVLVLRGKSATETRTLTVGPEDNVTLTIALGESPRDEPGAGR